MNLSYIFFSSTDMVSLAIGVEKHLTKAYPITRELQQQLAEPMDSRMIEKSYGRKPDLPP